MGTTNSSMVSTACSNGVVAVVSTTSGDAFKAASKQPKGEAGGDTQGQGQH